MSGRIVVDEFHGLNERLHPAKLGPTAATDLLNVDFGSDGLYDYAGALHSRQGSTQVADTNDTTITDMCLDSQSRIVFVGKTSTFTHITVWTGSASPSTTSTIATSASGNPQCVAYGDNTSSRVFVAERGRAMQRLTDTTVAASTGKPTIIAVSPFSNRLVQAGFAAAADSPTGANGSDHAVFFSDAGAPETYSANNFVGLRPGDGEVITAMVSWRELLFVFKQTAVFIFYGESTDEAGNPIFNYRKIDLPERIQYQDHRLACAGYDGVYFCAGPNLYITRGDVPENLTAALKPEDILLSVSYAGRRVWAARDDQVLVGAGGEWAVWNWGHGTGNTYVHRVIGNVSNNVETLYFDKSDKLMQVHGYWDLLLGYDDDGTAVSSTYTSGWLDLAEGQEAVVSSCEVSGYIGSSAITTSSLTFTVYNDDFVQLSSQTVPFSNVSETVSENETVRLRLGVRARRIFFKFTGSGRFQVSRLVFNVRDVRAPR